jgi:hypothetical protein
MAFDDKNVSILRLVSGEELLGLVTVTELGYSIKNPFRIFAQENPTQTLDGRPNLNIHLAPYLPLAELSVDLSVEKAVVVFAYRPNSDIVAKYKQIFLQMETGLILP